MTILVSYLPAKGGRAGLDLAALLARSGRGEPVAVVTVVPQHWVTPSMAKVDAEFAAWAHEQGDKALAIFAGTGCGGARRDRGGDRRGCGGRGRTRIGRPGDPMNDVLGLCPPGSRVDPDGMLTVGGRRADELADSYGTPVLVVDESALRVRARDTARHCCSAGRTAGSSSCPRLFRALRCRR